MRFATAKSLPTGVPASPPSFYVWKLSGRAFSIHLSHEVIDRLNADVMKGFWAVPKRGAEIGGVLLGRVEGNAQDPDSEVNVFVEDYERVNCEHRRGPSYVLSEADRKRLGRALRRDAGAPQPVGWFRSHTRPGLYLDENDMSVVRGFFSAPSDVVLLVRPQASGPGAAGFFVWELDDMRRHASYQEFPFSTAALSNPPAVKTAQETEPVLVPVAGSMSDAGIVIEPEPGSDVEPEPPRPTQVTPPVPAFKPVAEPRLRAQLEASSRGLLVAARQALQVPRVRMAAYALAALACFGIIEYQIVVGGAPRQPSMAKVASLRVDRSGAYLQVRWDPKAPAVAKAEKAVLSISDSGQTRTLQLDSADLRDGRVAYAPTGADISFRLELQHADRTLTESIRVITAQPAAAAPAARTPEPPKQAAEERAEASEPATVATKPERTRRRVYYDDGL